mgnify:CR=1 FL=1
MSLGTQYTIYTENDETEQEQKLIKREIDKKLLDVPLQEMDKYTITEEEHTRRREMHKIKTKKVKQLYIEPEKRVVEMSEIDDCLDRIQKRHSEDIDE